MEVAPMEDVRAIEDEKFSEEVVRIIARGEDMRLARSRSYAGLRRLYHITLSVMVMGTSSYLVWVLLMGGNPAYILLALAATFFLPLLVNGASRKVHRKYVEEFKTSFMPALAKALGKLSFHPTGGIGIKALNPAQILPAHDSYRCEDCFAGTYKGVKLMISEARLHGKNRQPAFSGVLVLLVEPKTKFRGHTIITADQATARRWKVIRWKKLSEVAPAAGIKAGSFLIFSDAPDEAMQLADQDLLDLLHKLSVLFDKSKLSIVFYQGNKVLLTIPYDGDMFEPGDIYMPVSNRQHALKCKKEIEQILSVIDLLDVYEPSPGTPSAGN